MAIENNLLHFETEETFQSERNNIKEQSITFVQESKKIYTHGKEYCMVNWGTLEEQNYVDLGLPSGKKWAKCNVGANIPEESGLYFQWGDTQGYTAAQAGNEEGQKSI